jgi:Tfp pilus assembly protein PilF
MNRPSPSPAASRLQGLPRSAIEEVIAAAQAIDRGQADTADHHLSRLLRLHPEHAEVQRLAAGLHMLRGEHAQAIAALRRGLSTRPGDALSLNTLGAALIEMGDYDEAILALKRACELDATLASAWFNLGLACMRCMRITDAADALRQAVTLSPEQTTARVMLADMLRAQGRNDDAVDEYRSVLSSDEQAGMAWLGLADMKTLRLGAEDIARLRAVMARPGLRDADLIPMGFALAKALDDDNQFAEALAVLRDAHARAGRHRAWDASVHTAMVEAVVAAFTPAPRVEAAELGSEVIFIASLPRSGSTLVEQVLGTHSQVEGAGELPDLPLVLTEESRRRGRAFPQWAAEMEPHDWQRLGRRYLERTRHWRAHRPRCTDKLPYNWLYVGAIRAMLPGARVILVRRDPLETCWSCYRQHLAGNHYTHRFLAQFLRDFARASERWCGLHAAHVRQQSYEELIADPRAQITGLLEFCALPFEPACLDFHASTRDVHTPSAAQVRQPLRSDTARAARYGSLLDPLRAALGLPALASGKS